MIVFKRKIDECIGIGGKIVLWPTDIDDKGVRVMVEGEDDAQIRRIAEDLRAVLKDEIALA